MMDLEPAYQTNGPVFSVYTEQRESVGES